MLIPCHVKAPENLDHIATKLQSSKAVNAVLRRFPQFGFAVRAIVPAGDLTTRGEDLTRHIIAHQVIREERQVAATTALSLLSEGKPLTKLFDIDDKGYVHLALKGKTALTPIHINTLIEGKALRRFDLTPEQLAALDLRKDIWSDTRTYFNRFGGKLDVEEDMFPRVVKEFIDPKTGKVEKIDVTSGKKGASSLSMSGGHSRARAMNADGSIRTAEEMVAEGWRYVDPDVALTQRVLNVSQRTADAQFVNWLTKRPDILKKAGILGPNVKTGVHEARWGMVGFDSSQFPALAGYYAPREVVDYLTKLMETSHEVLPIASSLVNASRGLIASMDFGTTGVQLLMALGADMGHLVVAATTAGRLSKPSNIFGKAVGNSFKSWFSPDNLTRYYASNKDLIDRWAPFIGGLRNTEYVSRILGENLSGPEKVVANLPLMKRFARAFEASLDIAKIEYIKSLEAINGKALTYDEMEALGGWVRNSTGTLSSARLGVSPQQQDIESTWLFFSPRFTRSLFAMVGTMVKMDKAGNEARLALGGLLASATAMYVSAAALLGQETDFQVTKNGRFNSDFFTLRIGDNRVGIGGGVRAMTRLAADSYEAGKDDPKRFISPDFRGADSNPLLSFWKSRTAPLTGTIIDFYTGEDFKGAPIEDGNDYVKLIVGRTLPFAGQAAYEAKGMGGTKTGVGLVAGFGMNTSPISSYQLYDEYLKGVETAYGEQRFPDGANTQHTEENGFKTFLMYDEKAKHYKSNHEEARLSGSRQSRDTQKILNERSQGIEAADALLAQSGDYRRYRSQINTIRAESRIVMETLHLDSVARTPDKKLVSSWYDTYDDPRGVDPVTKGIDSDGLEEVQDAWKRKHPGEWERVIEDGESIGSTPMETTLRKDRKVIADSGWWDTGDEAWTVVKEKMSTRGAGKRLNLASYNTYEDYQFGRRQELEAKYRGLGRKSPELLADIVMQRDPIATLFEKIRTRARLRLQKNDPTIISLLAKWGYNPVSKQEYRMAVAAQRRSGA